jgi:hypothetical protein
MEEKDLCTTCSHFWKDFPLPLDRTVYHCDILDGKCPSKEIDDTAPDYPCLQCPVDSYDKK